MSGFVDYVPHAAVVALAAVVSWVGKNHFEQDDKRFEAVTEAFNKLDDKLDGAIKQQSDNHAEVLKILIDR